MADKHIRLLGECFGGELSPDARKIVDAMHDPEAGSIEELDLHVARTTHALEDYDLELIDAGLSITERCIEYDGRSVNTRVYTPDGEGPYPILVFAHGGCWTFCSVDSHDRLCRYFCNHANCVVISVDYSLAPEHPFPAGIDDFTAVIRWCFAHADEVNGRSDQVAVAGDSAGGNLSAVAAQRLQDCDSGRLTFQLLLYPICDASEDSGNSMDRYAEGYFFTKEVLQWTAKGYCADYDQKEPGISPQYGDISEGIAPALIILAECDILRDQGERYANKLAAQGAEVECLIYRGVPHAFAAMAGALDAGRSILDYSIQQWKSHL